MVLLEHVREFLHDEQLQRMLVAADLSRPAPTVAPEATLAELIHACASHGAEAVVVGSALVTRDALGALLVKRFAAAQ